MSDDVEIGEDEVGLDEDEEAALDADDRTRWLNFFSWLGVNSSLRPVHFHDVEDRASVWLRTEGLRRLEGWAFQKIPEAVWLRFADDVRSTLKEKDQERFESTAPYFYRLHDLEHLVVLLEAAARDKTAQLGRALYEHLAHNWGSLERFARLQVAQVPSNLWPNLRTKPPRAYDQELVDAGDDLWIRRLQEAWFCPTGHGPRPASQVWLPTLEVQRRFGYRTRQYLVPALDVDPALTRGKARTFAQTLGMREELTPASFTADDAGVVLDRLETLYASPCVAGADLRAELRETIRPVYRNVLELLSNRERPGESRSPAQAPLDHAPLLAQDGAELDTRYCYMDQARFDLLRRQLPVDVTVLGIDEHTTALLDIAAHEASVIGAGMAHVVRAGGEQSFPAGQRFSLDLLSPDGQRAVAPQPSLDGSVTVGAHDAMTVSALPPTPQQDGDTGPQIPDAFVEALIALRADLRAGGRWRLADHVRDALALVGVHIQDTRAGTTWQRAALD